MPRGITVWKAWTDQVKIGCAVVGNPAALRILSAKSTRGLAVCCISLWKPARSSACAEAWAGGGRCSKERSPKSRRLSACGPKSSAFSDPDEEGGVIETTIEVTLMEDVADVGGKKRMKKTRK